MKLLVVSDLHFSLPQLDWLLKTGEQFNAVIIAGDLLDIAGHLNLDSQIVIVLKYLERLSEERPLFVCSGNHDGDAVTLQNEYVATWLKHAKGVHLFVDGQSYDLLNFRVTVLPWWDGPNTREAMESFIEKEANHGKDQWIWLHHAPPQESPTSWTGKKDAGDPNLRTLIQHYRPDFIFSGHIHNSPFRSGGSWHDQIETTHVFNGGKQIGDMPAHIAIDLEGREATWVSLAGQETVFL